MRLSQKLILLISLVTLSTATITGYFNYSITKDAILNNISEKQTQYSKQVFEKIDRLINKKIEEIDRIAKTPTVSKTIESINDSNIKNSNEIIQNVENRSDPWKSITIINTEGKIILETGEVKNHIDTDQEKIAFENAISGKSYYSDATPNSKDEISFIISKPIRSFTNPDRPVIGAVIGEIFWEEIQEIIIKDSKTTGPLLHLYNNKLQLIASYSKSEPIFKNDRGSAKNNHDGTGSNYNLAKNNGETFLINNIYQAGYSNFKSLGWILSAETPESSFKYSLSKQVWYTSSFLVLLLIIFGLLSLLINKQFILKPLNALEQNILANSYHKNKQNHTDTGKEFENLQNDFDVMLSDIKNSEKIIQEEAEKFKSVINNMTEGVIMVNTEMETMIENPAFANIFENTTLNKSNISFQTNYEIYTEDGKTKIPPNKLPINECLKQKRIINQTLYLKLKHKNKIKYIKTSNVPIINNTTGELTGAISVIMDVTEEVLTEKSKSEFIAIASHQLRTPPSAIKWTLELLKEIVPKTRKKEHRMIDDIMIENQKMIDLITSLLNQSRLELGTFKITTEPTDVNNTIKETLHSFQEDILTKQIKVTTDFDTELKPINLDRNLFGVVVKNTIQNAIQYNHKNGSLDIRTLKKDGDLIIKITDTGIGIPNIAKPSIFKKLFRADNAKTSDTSGTGLGLYIAKSILESCQGSITFDSIENQGTTFYVTIPLKGMTNKSGNTIIK